MGPKRHSYDLAYITGSSQFRKKMSYGVRAEAPRRVLAASVSTNSVLSGGAQPKQFDNESTKV